MRSFENPKSKIRNPKLQKGVTLIELLLVLGIMAILYTVGRMVIMPAIHQSRETTLKENLRIMRKAIDDFQADKRRAPASLGELIEQKYLKEIPMDPITKSRDTWKVVGAASGSGDIQEVRSGADGTSSTGQAYAEW